ncbi:MAG: hypothetical protein HY060_04465 [Proteobacteria bacterium]|nr:hypothetical protein [Pseudomonadota bacterium]
MHHLGVAYGHNATVAVVADGELIYCQSEERLNRLKNSLGIPWLTLEQAYGVVGGVDRIDRCGLFLSFADGYVQRATYSAPRGSPTTTANLLNADKVNGWRGDLNAAVAEYLAIRAAIEQAVADPANREAGQTYFAAQLGLPAAKLVEVPHHETHAYSVLPFLPADHAGPVLILTLDGEGDGLAATVARYADGQMTHLSSTPWLASLGRIYAYVTNILGFKMLEHEYKIMGMAPYAKGELCEAIAAELRKMLWVDDAGQWRARYRSTRDLAVALTELCAFQRLDYVAAALQTYTEDMMARWVAHWVAATGIGTVACAGGVFMNVKANQKLAALPGVEHLVVVPSCGDESCAIGAAVYASLQAEPTTPIRRIDNIYLGVGFSDDAVARYLADAQVADGFAISEPPDIECAVAALLARNEIVARCSGRMEFGARALGNRSILAHPSHTAVVEVINQAIKNRDFWMPFAPSILAECLDELIEDPKRTVSPYMMVSANTTARGRSVLAAAIHRADGTARPQRVERAANPGYHALISHFRDLTGIGAVLNTSFNLHGEPIVCSPHDAVTTVRQSGLKWLALNRFLLEKRATS